MFDMFAMYATFSTVSTLFYYGVKTTMNEKSDAPMKNITTMLDVLESQLCQAIVWLEAIKAISLAWNQSTVVRCNRFFSATVYDALWDALIIK